MKVDITWEAAHWLRYAIILTSANERQTPQQQIYLDILDKLNQTEKAELTADGIKITDGGDRHD